MTELLISAIGVLAMLILNDMRESIKEASKSVEKLNTNVAVILQRIEKHDEEIEMIKIQQNDLYNHIREMQEPLR